MSIQRERDAAMVVARALRRNVDRVSASLKLRQEFDSLLADTSSSPLEKKATEETGDGIGLLSLFNRLRVVQRTAPTRHSTFDDKGAEKKDAERIALVAARALALSPAQIDITRISHRNSVTVFAHTCLHRVLSSDTNGSPYLSGPELRLLLLWIDKKHWLAHAKDAPPNVDLAHAFDELKFNLTSSADLWISINKGMFLRVKLIASLRKHNTSAAALKSVVLWCNAVLHISLNLFSTSSRPSDERLRDNWILFTNYVLSVPLLVTMLDKSGLDIMMRNQVLVSCICVLDSEADFKAARFENINGEISLFVLGNLIELIKADADMQACLESGRDSSCNFQVFFSTSTRLLNLCNSYVKSKSSNMTRFHPVLQWYSGPQIDVPADFHNRLANILSFLWYRPFIQLAFEDLLHFSFPPPTHSTPLTKKPATPATFLAKLGFKDLTSPPPVSLYSAGTSATLPERETTPLAISTLRACNLYYALTRTLLNSSTHIVTSLCWTPALLPRLWRLIAAQGTRLYIAGAATQPSDDPWMPLCLLLCEACGVLFQTLDDADIYDRGQPFSLTELRALARFLNAFCFAGVWRGGGGAGAGAGSDPAAAAFDAAVGEAAQRLLGILYDQNMRRSFAGEGEEGEAGDVWIMREVMRKDFVEEVKRGDERALAVLNCMPQCIPFAHRVDIFRHMVKSDKATIGEIPMIITVRRRNVLEDGLRQLGRATPAQLKQTVKVKFVNELGLAEAGIDQNGVFKEFLEDLCKRAFASDLGLFRTTEDGNCVPSVASSVQDDHLMLLEFVGKIFGKALFEGIVIDIPFATFVYAKFLGRLNFFEDLSSLDAQLTKNLLFLKHYDGDASDLGLTFSIDEEVFGAVKSKEIKPGGNAIAVTNDNKYEYIHLMSDYKLNQECKSQFKALVGGFRSIMPLKYIHFFSPRELQVLMSGENVDFDVDDLRRHTRYEGGYFDQHPTIRLFWQVLDEMPAKDKSAFLKFVTSCSNPPVGGFRHLEPPFTLRYVAATSQDDVDANPAMQLGKAMGSLFGIGKDATRLPTASTCFNVLKLPAYQKKTSLKTKLTYAVKSGAGFELS
ncbi:hypothetical protein BC830DRAFT_1097505 [Chytriomyces sp. MP71]|nr:hypothetical protein BC830DRAFT_1097505 [Chytriomyces sp. MP71]